MPIDRDALVRALEPEPSGEHLLYEGTYQRLKEAMTTQAADEAYGIEEQRVDWGDVVRICSGALAEKTKDFYLGCCLLRGLIATDGPNGLVDGLWFLAELNEKFWADYHPRPRERRGTVNINGRANQLEALVNEFPQYLEGMRMDSAGTMSWYDWDNAGKKLPGGRENPWTAEDKEAVFAAASWDYYADACDDFARALDELKRLTSNVYDKFGDDALSLGPLKEGIEAQAEVFAGLLANKGPSPYLQQAQMLIAQSGSTLVDEAWLEQKLRGKTNADLIAQSLYNAVADLAQSYQPETAWTEIFESAWGAGAPYERRTEDPVVAAPPPIPADAPPAPEVAAGAPASVSAPAAVAAPPVRIVAPAGGDPMGVVLGACQGMRLADPMNALAYSIPRFVRWSALVQADPAVPLPAPSPQMRQQCEACAEAADYAQLLNLTESIMVTGPGWAWLDLQLYATMAIGNLFDDYSCEARWGIIRLVDDLVRRHEWLVTAQMDDGNPVASERTRGWLASDEFSAAGAGDEPEPDGDEWGGPEPETGGPVDLMDTVRRDAMVLLANDDFNGAVTLLDGEVRTAQCARDRARLQLVLGEICLEANRPELARPVLERVRSEIKTRSLYDWESQVFLGRALEALHGSYRLLLSIEGSEDVAARMATVADELAQVDLARALRLQAL